MSRFPVLRLAPLVLLQRLLVRVLQALVVLRVAQVVLPVALVGPVVVRHRHPR
jgi:hypothetical protein